MADRITIRVSQDVADALDRFIAEGVLPAKSKQDAFRHIVADWLTTQGYLPSWREQEQEQDAVQPIPRQAAMPPSLNLR
jgi:hypothetical protein